MSSSILTASTGLTWTRQQFPTTPCANALAVDWPGQRVWLNPPYGRGVGKWLEKAYREARTGKIVGVLVFARTDTAWWHDYAMKARMIYLIRGRLKFIGDDDKPGNSATAPSCFVVFGPCAPLGGPQFVALEIPKPTGGE